MKEIFCGVCKVIFQNLLYLSTYSLLSAFSKEFRHKIEGGRRLLGKQREHSKYLDLEPKQVVLIAEKVNINRGHFECTGGLFSLPINSLN